MRPPLAARSWPEPVRAALAAALERPASQQPAWPDEDAVHRVRAFLRAAEVPASAGEVSALRARLAEVAEGRALVLQGGDCAETFADATRRHLEANLAALHASADAIGAAAALPVVRIARMAGQFAKPRSADVDALGLPAYRGDMVNSVIGTPRARRPDPVRMRSAYHHASAAMGVLRGSRPEVFAGHEALVLDYEASLVRLDPSGGRREPLLGGSAHFLWIGERTRQLDGAHVAFARLLANPVGVKLGPTTTPAQALAYAETLDPGNEPGRLTLISRMGRDRVRDLLPPIVERIRDAGRRVVWQCDPMHGNTRCAASGRKTRSLEDVLAEVVGYLEVHREAGTHPGGLHLEFTGDAVTECVGAGVAEHELGLRYRTACDPRLNPAQLDELSAAVAGMLSEAVAVR